MPEQEFFDVSRSLKDYTEDELRAELEQFRAMWSWLDEEVKYYAARVGHDCRFVTRAQKGYLGTFRGVKWQAVSFEMDAATREWDDVMRVFFFESKIMHVPASSIFQMEFVSWREQDDSAEQSSLPFNDKDITEPSDSGNSTDQLEGGS